MVGAQIAHLCITQTKKLDTVMVSSFLILSSVTQRHNAI